MNSTSVIERIDGALEDLESRLPGPLAAPIGLQRAVAERAAGSAQAAASQTGRSASRVATVAANAARTVLGTARWTLRTTAKAASTAQRTVTGQAKAQGQRVADTMGAEVGTLASKVTEAGAKAGRRTTNAIDAATTAVESDTPLTNESLDDLSKDELYRRARTQGIEGRSNMTKAELIDAIAATSA